MLTILLIAFDSVQAFFDDETSIMKPYNKPSENNVSGCDFANSLSSLDL